ncbi:Galactokinase [Actinomadura rubteroloni]|uniref:Galactokinase n=1 Tax=Actinomadura rubteroloni TaxID=1926885 RepID=A0A2P4UQ88_9ACTN|nr:galactokinase [Actinomadura rubteroloni]POM27213.1 Galactokinase [Actinomadura rubteroloni]
MTGGRWRAPGRVVLLGEEHDPDGPALTVAIPGGVTVDAERSDTLDLPGDAWTAPAADAARRLAARGAGGVAAKAETGLPPGLGAPGALAAAVALALRDLYALDLDAPSLVPFAAEPGRPDAATSLLGAAGRALLVDRRTGAAGTLPCDVTGAGLALFAVDTRASADPGLAAERRDECAAAARLLGVASLGDVRDLAGALGTLRDPVLRRRVQHVVTERHRIDAAAGLLRAGAVAELGAMLNASQMSLRDQFQTSWPQADATVDTALRAGARGARISGGPGGAVTVLAPADRVSRVQDAVRATFTARDWPGPAFHDATPSPAAARVPA